MFITNSIFISVEANCKICLNGRIYWVTVVVTGSLLNCLSWYHQIKISASLNWNVCACELDITSNRAVRHVSTVGNCILDVDLYLDMHQIAHICEYYSPKLAFFYFIKIYEKPKVCRKSPLCRNVKESGNKKSWLRPSDLHQNVMGFFLGSCPAPP